VNVLDLAGRRDAGSRALDRDELGVLPDALHHALRRRAGAERLEEDAGHHGRVDAGQSGMDEQPEPGLEQVPALAASASEWAWLSARCHTQKSR